MIDTLKCKWFKNVRRFFAMECLFSKPYPSLEGKTHRWGHIPICNHSCPPVSTCFRIYGCCYGDERGITMAAIEIFSSSITYKYKSRIHSCASIVVFLFIVLSLVTPLFIIYNAGGKNWLDFFVLHNFRYMQWYLIFLNFRYLDKKSDACGNAWCALHIQVPITRRSRFFWGTHCVFHLYDIQGEWHQRLLYTNQGSFIIGHI